MSTSNSYKPICMSKQINSTIIDPRPQILDAPYLKTKRVNINKRSFLSLNKAAKTCKHL